LSNLSLSPTSLNNVLGASSLACLGIRPDVTPSLIQSQVVFEPTSLLFDEKTVAVQDKFKQIVIAEMKHAEKIAERVWYIGGTPTTKPSGIEVGKNLKKFLEFDTKAEVEAIEMYQQVTEIATEEKDITTAFIFKEILEDEEEHHDLFTTMLEEV
jgi:bacterioferritin